MEIELYSKLQDPIASIDRIGELFAKSGMFGCDRIEQGKVLAMVCLAERKSPVEILREYHIIEGRLSDRADSMLAKFRGRGGKHKVISRTADEVAVALTVDGETQTFRLTWAECQAEPYVWSNKTDASGARLPKKNYATPRARMQTMWARVISDGVRTMAPEIVAGISTPEEIEDQHGTTVAPALVLAPPVTEPPKQLPPPQPATVVVEFPKAKVAEPAPVVTVTAPPPPPRVETSSAEEQELAGMGLAQSAPPPAAKPAPPPQPPPPAPPPPPPKSEKLTDDVVSAVTAAIEGSEAAAFNWMLKNRWLTQGQTLHDLAMVRAQRIIKNKDSFLRAIRAGQGGVQ